LVVVLACDGFAARSGLAEDVVVVKAGTRGNPSTIRKELGGEYDHPEYRVELAPHFLPHWGDLP
jgi:hypothetical protein